MARNTSARKSGVINDYLMTAQQVPRGALSFVADLTQSKRKHKFCNAIIN